MKSRAKPIATFLLVVYLAVLFYLTLSITLTPGERFRWNLIPFATITEDIQEHGKSFVLNFIGNLLLFIPLGYLAPIVFDRAANLISTGLMGLILSTVIEVLQSGWGERMGDIDDVILNTISTLIGYACFFVWRELQGKSSSAETHEYYDPRYSFKGWP